MNLKSLFFNDVVDVVEKVIEKPKEVNSTPKEIVIDKPIEKVISKQIDLTAINAEESKSPTNSKIFDSVHAAVLGKGDNKINSVFISFLDLFEKMSKIIPNNTQCVAAVLTSLNIPCDDIIKSINDNHKPILEIYLPKDFEEDINIYTEENITNKDIEIKLLQAKIEENKNTINELQKENIELENSGQELYTLISTNTYKLNQRKRDFNDAISLENKSLDSWIDILTKYNNSLKDS